jgi:hypothetical protein
MATAPLAQAQGSRPYQLVHKSIERRSSAKASAISFRNIAAVRSGVVTERKATPAFEFSFRGLFTL